MPDDDRLSLYDYDLPPARIAQRPAQRRDTSRLMVLRGAAPPEHRVFSELPDILRAGDLLVRNDTRVFPARLRARRAGGGKTELLLVRRLEESPAGERHWLCLARPTSHLKPSKTVLLPDGEREARILRKRGAGQVEVAFPFADEADFLGWLREYGETPLPPYIRRDAGPDAADAGRYQTHYARTAGAVAAPTAGLHFTAAVDAALVRAGVTIRHLTLHVGPGTFRPIVAEHLDAHRMDEEFYSIDEETAAAVNAARREGRRRIAVGTTTTRALESAVDENGEVRAESRWTDLFLRPGARFRAIEGLLTNFHLPRSSLLVLVAALAGRERILAAYAEAVREGYRFYSYGDAMLILP